MITNKRIVDSGSHANVVSKYMRHLIQGYESCDGNIVGAGGRIIDAIVGKGLLSFRHSDDCVLWSNMPKSVFSVGVFTGDHRFEMTFKRDRCVPGCPQLQKKALAFETVGSLRGQRMDCSTFQTLGLVSLD